MGCLYTETFRDVSEGHFRWLFPWTDKSKYVKWPKSLNQESQKSVDPSPKILKTVDGTMKVQTGTAPRTHFPECWLKNANSTLTNNNRKFNQSDLQKRYRRWLRRYSFMEVAVNYFGRLYICWNLKRLLYAYPIISQSKSCERISTGWCWSSHTSVAPHNLLKK